jgi:hypothetical protein
VSPAGVVPSDGNGGGSVIQLGWSDAGVAAGGGAVGKSPELK